MRRLLLIPLLAVVGCASSSDGGAPAEDATSDPVEDVATAPAEDATSDPVEDVATAPAEDVAPEVASAPDVAPEVTTADVAPEVGPPDTAPEVEGTPRIADVAPELLNGTYPPEAKAVPSFEALNYTGELRTAEHLLGQPTVMWFFPFSGTPG